MGVIRQTKHQRTGGGEDFYRYVEFHPIKLAQFEKVDSEAEGSVKEFQRYDHRSPLRFSITEHSVQCTTIPIYMLLRPTEITFEYSAHWIAFWPPSRGLRSL